MWGKNKSELTMSNDIQNLEISIQDNSVERGEIKASNSKRANAKVKTLLLAAGGLIAAASLVISIMSLDRENEEPAVQEEQPVVNTPRSNFAEEMNRLLREQSFASPSSPPEALAPTVVPEATQASSTVIVQATPTGSATPLEPDTDELRRLSGNVLAFEGSKSSMSTGDTQSSGTGSLLNDKMTRAATPLVKANRRPDLTYLLRKGTNVACTLHTKIITTQPGFTRCYVSKDVYSADGKILLIERGSEIIGEQTTGLNQGQARVFVMWHTIETPRGVKIEIDSPTADTLGAAGQEAQVDTHFWERFGGAIMLSMIDDVMGIASNRIDNRDYRFENTQDNIQSMAEEALRNTINIPPTGYVNQGTLLNIIIARDVDFKDVYELVRIN